MPLTEQLDRLAGFEPAPYPVVSLYLDTRPNQHGRDQHQAFTRKELKARSRTYPANSPERESLDRDIEQIVRFLDNDLNPSANSVAIFACSAGELFETVQSSGVVPQHGLYIGDRPHLYPLARLESQSPRYAALVTDTNTAHILVISAGELVADREVKNVKTKATSQGGWSQARYQRHIENFHIQHVKEVVAALDRVVQDEGITHILISCDEVALPLLREQLPKQLADKVVDHIRVEAHAAASEVLKASMDAMHKLNAKTDREKVDAAIGAYRAGALGIVGPEDTLAALIKGQVDELLITADLQRMEPVAVGKTVGMANDARIPEPVLESTSAGEPATTHPEVVRLADELIAKAKQTSARITFVEDPELLSEYGGVAALLRFKI
ncbi:MAG TPA: Vms1/Ankzf1 family peptidyl-tRNA hydrolase [Vicinamibacterales bacterium]|jgi:peptide chain release factor subunit 1|nr:Vms1/Ankzf1 family peptidyl-tRNA hydrolase [Vicinamibacterales bacterium]